MHGSRLATASPTAPEASAPPPGTSLRASLRRQFFLVGVLPLLAAMVVALIFLVPSLLQQGQARNLELATAVRDQVLQELASRQRSAALVATELTAGRLLGPSVSATLRTLVDHDDLLLAAYLTDERGIVSHLALPSESQLSMGDFIGLDQSTQPHFVAARRSGLPVWSETFLSALTDRMTAVLALPAGERTLIVELALDDLSHSLADIGRAARTQPIVIDRSGRVIGHPDPLQAVRQENLRHLALVRRAIEGQSGSERITLGGASQLAQALPVAPIGWTVLVLQPTREVLAPVIALVWALAGVLSCTLLAAAGLSWWLARRSAREVEHLAHAADVVANTPVGAPTPGAMVFHISEFRTVWGRLQSLFAELHQRDQQTDAARRELQAVLDAATEVAIVTTDTDGRVTIFSVGAQKMLHRREHEVRGQLTPVAWHDEAELCERAEELNRQFGRAISAWETLVCHARHAGYEVRDWTFVRSDGERLEVSLAVTAMRNAGGELTGFLCVAIDVSQRRRAADLEVSKGIAEAASQAKSEFLSRMSHELRTPLNAVLGYAQLIELNTDEPITATQQRHLAQIQRSGWHLVQLIDDVLDLARIESGHMRVSIEPLPVAQVVARALEIATPLMRKNDVTFTTVWRDGHDGAQLAPVMGDMTRLTQVLVNLLTNAAKYNRPGGSVTLECEALPEHRLALRVIDTGPGMTEAQLAQLFQPFNRLGREASKVEGTGIGLVITRRLLTLMHGSLDVRSTPGEGSVFSVLLPQQGALAVAAPLPVAPVPAASGSSHGVVLYIEDNEVNATLMRELMRQRPAVELLQAGTAADGLIQARQRVPDLILLDMHLPDADGFAVLDALAGEPRLAAVPVLAISADATRAQVASALARGVRAYLTKPINVAEVLAQLDAVLANGAAPPR